MTDNNYYVYLHRRLDNGDVFYVGKGNNRRAWAKARRNKEWNSIVNQTQYVVEIIKDCLTNDEALTLELSMIETLPNLTNKITRNRVKEIPEKCLSKYFLDSESPSGLSKITKNGKKVTVGSISYRYKTKEPSGWFVHVSPGFKVAAHRIIMELQGYFLTEQCVINHIDCNPLNNLPENLEVVTTKQNNQRNRVTRGLTLSTNNRSGITGVLEIVDKTRNRMYKYAAATWSENGKSKVKRFSYNKYGKDAAWVLAIEYRNSKLKLYESEILK